MTGTTGLSPQEAACRLAEDGFNELPPPPRPSALRRLLGQFVHFFAVMLWAAGVLAIVADLVELGLAIFLVIVVNGIFAFLQERRSDRAAERLRDLLPHQVTVRRGVDVVVVDARTVVRDDVLVLGAGDRVPADATVATARAAQVDTSLLTGESVPTAPAPGDTVFAGTFLVDGELEAVVTATGARTRLADIAALTTATPKHASPLTEELHRLVRTVAVIAVGVGLVFLALSALLGMSISKATVFAIGVTVALVPEGLLPTVTLSLSIGAQRMAERQALVRRLDAVETLGSTTFICTDKTGTLTRNEMAVVEAWTPSGRVRVDGHGYEPTATVTPLDGAELSALAELGRAAARCSTGRAVRDGTTWRPQGDPMEAAIDAYARRLGVDADADRRAVPERWRLPFDADRKRMTVALADGTVVVKGALEAVLPLCTEDHGAPAVAAEAAGRGHRVLAVAAGHPRLGDDPIDPAGGLTLLGLLCFQDPPRSEARTAIDACRRAGIKVAMLTGDHPATALAIARDVGLAGPGSTVLRGDELPADDAQLGALVDRDGVVIARVTPEDKLRIARALRARGHVLAMTGDGVNDGPALHEADIGVAMGRSGTDVAREAADLVLLDDDFATIVAAIAQGRATYQNVRRFLTYHLTDNVAELTPYVLWAMTGGRFPLALGVLQILALDIGTDTASASALGAEAPAPHVLDRPPVSGRLLDRTVAVRAFAVLGPTEAAFEILAFITVFALEGWRPGRAFPDGSVLTAASGAAFLTVVIAQTANAWACRSISRPAWQMGWTTNRLLLFTASGELAFALAVVLIGPIAHRLEHRWPPLAAWPVVLMSAAAVLLVDAVWKRLRHRPDA